MCGHKDAIQWNEEREKYFLEILAERVRKYPNGSLIFKPTEWTEMDDEIYVKFGLRYGPDKLKAKCHRLRYTHKNICELINNTGVTWDPLSGKVLANDTVWDEFLMRDKVFNTFKKNGCKLYPLLSSVFGSSTGSRAFHYASTSSPQTSNKELRLEGCEIQSTETASKKRKSDMKTNSRNDNYEALIDALSQSTMARNERKLPKADKYKTLFNEVATSMAEEGSIVDCMAVLEATPGVSTTSYNKALEYFLEVNWRKMFLLMSKDRRKAWLDSLDDKTGRTYRFCTGRKVYRFGYGLSYSKYLYKFVSITQTTLFLSKISSTGFTLQNSDSVHYTSVTNTETESCKNAKFSATVSVQNHGEMEGRHPVLLFVNQNDVGNGKPMKQLAGFESVKTKGGERVQVEFVINPCEHFTTANEEGLMVIEEGSRYLSVGDHQILFRFYLKSCWIFNRFRFEFCFILSFWVFRSM